MRRSTGISSACAAALAALVATAPAAPASDRSMGFSGRCPIDVIFPMSVDADRAREFVPAGYQLATEGLGEAVIVVSLVACEDTVVGELSRSYALYSDLLIAVQPPPDSGTPLVDQVFDAYWSWVVTDEPVVHAGLSRLGMFHGFDPDMSLTPTWSPVGDRLLALDGMVAWPHSPFRLRADIVDATPIGIPPYFNHFWHDVAGGVLKAKLHKQPAGGVTGEEGRLASFTLTTPASSQLARLLDGKCAADAGAQSCSVSGPGFVTYLPHFDYGLTVLGRRTRSSSSTRCRRRASRSRTAHEHVAGRSRCAGSLLPRTG